MAASDITYEQVEKFCKERDLCIISYETFYALRDGLSGSIGEQCITETKTLYEARNNKLRSINETLVANVQNLEHEIGSLRFRYDNMKKLLNQFIATGLIPGYFDIYNQLCQTKGKLKYARKEAAAANKRYKQLKKEFSRYRNEHTDSDCNCHIQQLKRDIDLYKSQMAQLELNFEEYKKEHPEKAVEFKCEECASSYKDTTSDGADIMYCCESMVDGKCECDSGCVSDVRTCPGFRPKEKPNE